MGDCVLADVPLYTLPKTHECWTDYYLAIDRIIAAGGSPSLNQLKAGDPWGNPYQIDENEGDPDPMVNRCRPDYILTAGSNGIPFGPTTIEYHFPLMYLTDC